MDKDSILACIDHTLLRPDAAWAEISVLCDEAVRYGTASVCIPPSYVSAAASAFPGLNIGTVVGFPLGYATTGAKVFESREAVKNGAYEVDMVINIGMVKNRRYSQIINEIAAVKEESGVGILKVIVETCYLTESEKIELCQCVYEGKGDYIKTSTGFGSGGALLDDVRLFKEHLPETVKIKAAGGINSIAEMEAFLLAGADRLGTSKGVSLLK